MNGGRENNNFSKTFCSYINYCHPGYRNLRNINPKHLVALSKDRRIFSKSQHYSSFSTMGLKHMIASRSSIPRIFGILLCLVITGKMITSIPSDHTSEKKKLKKLYDGYKEAHFFDHWLEYADRYQLHLPNPKNIRKKKRKIRMLEIGVQSGGSVRVWKQYYGNNLVYTGLDADSRCKRSESPEENIFIEIGSQENHEVLKSVCDKYGPFHVIVDDGGHTNNTITNSLLYLFPRSSCMHHRGIYVIEDTHTVASEGSYGISEIPAGLFASMHTYWAANQTMPSNYDEKFSVFAGKIEEIHLYDSMIFISKGEQKPLTRIHRGTDRF